MGIFDGVAVDPRKRPGYDPNDPLGTGATTAKPTFSYQPKPGDVFGDLQAGGETMSKAVGNQVGDMISGKAYDPYKTESNEAFARAAQNLKAQAAGGFGAPRIGQGSAIRSQQGVEQDVMAGMSTNLLKQQQDQQAMKERGVGLGMNLAQSNESKRQFDVGANLDTQKAAEGQRMNDITAGLESSKFGEGQYQSDVSGKLEETKLNENARQFGITNATDIQKFNDTLKYDYASLSQADKQWLQGFGLDEAKFTESKRQFDENLTINKDSTYGYTDSDGNHVKGSMDIAAGQLGLQGDTLDLQKKELFGYTEANGVVHQGKYDLLSATDKRDADRLYGYTDKTTGKHVNGEMDIQQAQVDIAKNSDKRAGDQLYGYTDPTTGERVKGSADIAQGLFDLQSSQYEDQKKELFGYLDPRTNQWVNGKYDLLNKSDKRTADELYGYSDADGNKHLGTLDLQAASVDIQKQGMSLNEAKIKGYSVTDPTTGEVTHVPGEAENAAKSLGLQAESVDMQRKELLGYYDAATGRYVNGKMGLLNKDQQDKAKQLYGYDKVVKGVKVHVMGSMDLAQKSVVEDLNLRRQSMNKTYDIQNRTLKLSENDAASAAYWDTSKRLATFAQTHLDVKDPFEGSAGGGAAIEELKGWFKAKYGRDANVDDPAFELWAKAEWKAATDSRLTNPIDQAVYAINSSATMTDAEKAQNLAILKMVPKGVSFTADKDGKLVATYDVESDGPGDGPGDGPTVKMVNANGDVEVVKPTTTSTTSELPGGIKVTTKTTGSPGVSITGDSISFVDANANLYQMPQSALTNINSFLMPYNGDGGVPNPSFDPSSKTPVSPVLSLKDVLASTDYAGLTVGQKNSLAALGHDEKWYNNQRLISAGKAYSSLSDSDKTVLTSAGIDESKYTAALVYKKLSDTAQPFSATGTTTFERLWPQRKQETRHFPATPEIGKVISVNGSLYKVITTPIIGPAEPWKTYVESGDVYREQFTAYNLSTGQTETIKSGP